MSKGSGQAMDLDGFLGHSTRGAGASFLDNWTQREKPEVRVVLHTKAPIMASWMHPWPRIQTREKDGKETREVWAGSFNSWETEEVLKMQYRRDDAGNRQVPPTVCPMSLMLEQVYQLFRQGQLRWSDPLFKFVGDDPKKAKVLHVGSMLNLMKKMWDDLSSEEKRAAVNNGFPPPSEAWKETMIAKCQYIFTVVEYDDVSAGLQIAKQTALVGDKTKKAINDRITAEGPEKGHPHRTPYVIKWTYNAAAKQFDEKYHAVAIGDAVCKITDAIRELVVDKDPPDISRMIERGDIVDLRASMEDHYIGPKGLLDWDYIFGTAEKILGLDKLKDGKDAEDLADEITGDEGDDQEQEQEQAPAVETKAPVKEEPKAAAEPAAQAGGRKRRTAKPAEDPKYVVADRRTEDGEEREFAADGMELMKCDECETLMRADEDTCRNCGAKYDIQPEPAGASATAQPTQTKAAPAQAVAKAAAQPAGTAEAKARATGKEKLGF